MNIGQPINHRRAHSVERIALHPVPGRRPGVTAAAGRSLTADVHPLIKHPPVVPAGGRSLHHPAAGDVGWRRGRPGREVGPLVPGGVADVVEAELRPSPVHRRRSAGRTQEVVGVAGVDVGQGTPGLAQTLRVGPALRLGTGGYRAA